MSVYAFNIARRYGKTVIAHRLATQGFLDRTPVYFYHISDRSKAIFDERYSPSFHSLAGRIAVGDIPSNSVLIVDNVMHAADVSDMNDICKTLTSRGCTVLLFGTQIEDIEVDHMVTIRANDL